MWHCWKLHGTLNPTVSSPETWFSKVAAQVAAVTSVQPSMLRNLHVLKTWIMAAAATSVHTHCVDAHWKKSAHEIATAQFSTKTEVPLQSFTEEETPTVGNQHIQPHYHCSVYMSENDPSRAMPTQMVFCIVISQWQKEKCICFSRIKMKKKKIYPDNINMAFNFV